MDLVTFLKKNENSRKIFGERELKIIEKQLWGVSLTQSEKNRLSRDIRKKFDFIKEMGYYEFDFDLKKSGLLKETVNNTKDSIIRSRYFSKIRKILLYGSSVEKKRRLGSDIDIAVEFDKIEKKEIMDFIAEFSHDKRIQIEAYNLLPEKLKKEIDEKGEVLYERKN